MVLLGIDIGTTHIKAGLFAPNGRALRIVTCPNRAKPGWGGILSYDPDRLWMDVCKLLFDLHSAHTQDTGKAAPVRAVGICSMAETGLLVDSQTGEARIPFIPWFETCATDQADAIGRIFDREHRFYDTGLRPGYKYGLVKLLWLQTRFPELLPGGLWLSASDYIALRLTGNFATDYTLAERTFAFRLGDKTWDRETLRLLGLPQDLFPPAVPSGSIVGQVRAFAEIHGLPAGTPVAVAGHDHVCGAFAAGALIEPGHGSTAFDSMGTAETLIGDFPARPLRQTDYTSGFAFGLCANPQRLYWQGGLSMSGGSLVWLRSILSAEPTSFDELDYLLQARGDHPSGILYFPYLAGSGSPHSNPHARGAFLGLNAGHNRADLVMAVMEGCAFELEWMRRRAEIVVGGPVTRITAAGGGTRSRRWMQMKANIFGCPVDAMEQEETSLLGAALLAGLGSGVYSNPGEMYAYLDISNKTTFAPDPMRRAAYLVLFEEGYLKFESMIQGIRIPGPL